MQREESLNRTFQRIQPGEEIRNGEISLGPRLAVLVERFETFLYILEGGLFAVVILGGKVVQNIGNRR